MSVLSDITIRERLALPPGDPQRLVIEPFANPTKIKGMVSWGLSSYGYDIRLGDNYLIFSDIAATEVDPLSLAMEVEKRTAECRFASFRGVKSCLIPPNSFCLAESLEWFEMPHDCLGQIFCKSTYARCGICLNTTAIEPSWNGILTLEIANMTRLPARIHSHQGIGQVIFHLGDIPCAVPYDKKPGCSYQNQKGLTLPRA